jgi:hypothetical protein
MIHRLIFKLYFDESYCLTSELTYHDNHNIKIIVISCTGNYYFHTNPDVISKILEDEE